jgi:hypothetical protein
MDGMPARLVARLEQLGVGARVELGSPAAPGVERTTARLARGGSAHTYTLLYGEAVSMAAVARAAAPGAAGGSETDRRPVLVFTTFVAPRTADAFRGAGVQFLDTAGNAWVEFGDVLIDVRGRPRPAEAAGRTRASGSLFSTARAQVVFALLAWPQLWTRPQRDVAHVAGVSLGQVHNTLALLAEAGYDGDRGHRARAGQVELLDLWAAGFATGLARRLTLATYRGDVAAVKPVGAADAIFVSGESAATHLLRPVTLTLYVGDLDPRLPVVNRWRADGVPNIVVRRAFWRAPRDDDAPPASPRPAPWPLVYADLLASDDPRVRGAAREWRDEHARPEQSA